jgi:hypothetical protein
LYESTFQSVLNYLQRQNKKCSVTEANEGRNMSLQEAASRAGRRATKFCPANVQKIKDFVAQGMSRNEIAELLDVPLGSLQVTCSRLGIGLRRRHVLNGNASHSRVMNGNGTRHDIPNHPLKRAEGKFQVTVELNGARRTTDLPLTARDMSQLAIEAAVRNVGMAQLLTEIVITAIKKYMIKEILSEPSPDPAPQAVPESR